MGVDGTGSCSVVGFGTNSIEPMTSATTVLLYEMCREKFLLLNSNKLSHHLFKIRKQW